MVMNTFKAGDRVTNGFATGTVAQLRQALFSVENDTHVWVEWDTEVWDDPAELDSVHADDLKAV